MEIGENIQRLRKSRHMTQSELAEKLGISEQAVSKWENGISCPDISTLPMIARVFCVSIDSLYGFNLESYDEEVERLVKEADEKENMSMYENAEFFAQALTKYPNSA